MSPIVVPSSARISEAESRDSVREMCRRGHSMILQRLSQFLATRWGATPSIWTWALSFLRVSVVSLRLLRRSDERHLPHAP